MLVRGEGVRGGALKIFKVAVRLPVRRVASVKGITHWMGITGTFCESCGQEDSELREGSLAFVLRPFCMDANYSIQLTFSCSLWMRGKFSHPSLHLLAEYCGWQLGIHAKGPQHESQRSLP